jgi:hypothetical protein
MNVSPYLIDAFKMLEILVMYAMIGKFIYICLSLSMCACAYVCVLLKYLKNIFME